MTPVLKKIRTSPGGPLPLGTNVFKNGVQFSLFSRNAKNVSLILFESESIDAPYSIISLDPHKNKTGDIWHIWIEGIKEGQVYGYKIDGAYEPEKGHRFNRNKLIIDPTARALTTNGTWNLDMARGYEPDSPLADLSFSELDSTPHVPRCVIINNKVYTSHKPLNLSPKDIVIYELHVRGYTFHESSGTADRGTFKSLTEKIPYLRELGVTSVELMPVMEFEEHENININPETGERLKNYWGYSTLAFFAPKGNYATSSTAGAQYHEFKNMVKKFHDAGIEVILDIVFNHTAEGDQKGPTVSFRGIDNSIYYILESNNRYYMNYSGCGNTFNCNHPCVRDFILDCLRYWVIEMHIDGFRFDLASILGRDRDGNILHDLPLIERIEEDPILRNTKIIAEAWDAAGAYMLGKFPGRWAEWNGRFRDDVRRFWRGDPTALGDFATRISGSSDLYQKSGRGPSQSINFITCHDGFTLNDLVSYNYKHNINNGEDNRDGENNNLSWNFGIEGGETTPFIERTRVRQIKNFLTTLFISQGSPMLTAGDEFRRTQQGNNNAYSQDNEISWIDWSLKEKNAEIFDFTRKLIRFRKAHPILRKNTFFTGGIKFGFSHKDISWFNFNLGEPAWMQGDNSLAMLIAGEYAAEEGDGADSDIFAIFNASMISNYCSIPASPSGRPWKLVIDTSLDEPDDIMIPGKEKIYPSDRYYSKKLSVIVLIA